MVKKVFKIVGFTVFALFTLLLAVIIYVRIVAAVDPPLVESSNYELTERKEISEGSFTLGRNLFRKSDSGLYEMYVEGNPYSIGLASGKLAKELVQFQEVAFTNQIRQLVPSEIYLSVLKYFVGWFNRDLEQHIPEEYKQEIYGVSQVASHEFDDIAPPFQRILNYHAAHDIGHALQNMSLVGCTSFATWGNKSEDSTLIIGRNFDFYVGDDFARDKIIALYRPEKGHAFMMITFGGMTGVLSGMNEQGLTVTINAAKSEVPTASATPVSLVAREILQYASTIDEAYAIAKKRKMFVSESFLIGSAKDRRAAIIEKTPEEIDLVEATGEYLVCTNHFQGKVLGNTPLNTEHKRTSASVYRHQRVNELLNSNGTNTVAKTASILRNQLGLQNADIGLGNEKSINQLIAHHGIIFQPEKKLVWVSTAPWQLGKFVCYDLSKVFKGALPLSEIYEQAQTLPADSFLLTKNYSRYLKFAPFRFPFQSREGLQPDSLIAQNPNSYLSYMLAGDFYLTDQQFEKARAAYEIGLTKEVATLQERDHMMENLTRCKKEIK
ncbi:MAG: peptidase C45 [Cyclobacteriaceae bacterium]|nr:peptidase C45 [Cyclobacteriaceae bacterium]